MEKTRLLIIENGLKEEFKDTSLNEFIREHEKIGSEITLIERASQKPMGVLVKAFLEADTIAFQSTFIREHEIVPIGKLLAGVGPKKIYVKNLSISDLISKLHSIFDLETLASLAKHEVYELRRMWDDGEACGDRVDLQPYKDKWDEQEAKRIEQNHSYRPTGRKVRIGKIIAQNPQFAHLKEGDIVDELDCRTHPEEKKPFWGVWVFGKDEPVRLLNDNNYEEFEFAELTCFGLSREFISRGKNAYNNLIDESVYKLLAEKINRVGAMDATELWEFCDSICRLVGAERRGNRRFLEKKLKEYGDKHKYFCEIDKYSSKFRA